MIFNDKKWIWNLFVVRYVLLRCLSWLSVRYALIISVCAMFAFLFLLLLSQERMREVEWASAVEMCGLIPFSVVFPYTEDTAHFREVCNLFCARWRSMGTHWRCLRGVGLMTSLSGFVGNLSWAMRVMKSFFCKFGTVFDEMLMTCSSKLLPKLWKSPKHAF